MSHQLNSQFLKSILSLFDNMSSTVIWICTADYKKQLYLNKGYQNIWGRPTEEMFNDISSWVATLVPEDLKHNLPELQRRTKEAQAGVAHFRVIRPNGDLRYIKSYGYPLTDYNNKPKIIVGIDENLPPEEWHKEKNSQKKQLILPAFADDLTNILAKELSLTSKPETTSEQILLAEEFYIKGEKINLTHREKECLYWLCAGKSAKEIARIFNISPRTVEIHIDHLRIKTKSRTKFELISKMFKVGVSNITTL